MQQKVNKHIVTRGRVREGKRGGENALASLGRAARFAVDRGGAAKDCPEPLDEIAEVLKAYCKADFHNRLVGFPQKPRGALNAQEVYMLHKGAAQVRFEKGAEILRRHPEMLRDLR